MRLKVIVPTVLLAFGVVAGQAAMATGESLDKGTTTWIQQAASAESASVIAWRRDLHQHPELGRFEVRTSKIVADHLRALGMEVVTGVAKTGVIGVLKGGKPGPVVALRADMDALPIKEETGLPFASQAKGNYFGKTVDVMHACGHDGHTAMLMGAAEILAKNKDKVSGTVVFVFQPSEEGAADLDDFTDKEHYGARKILEEGVFDKYKVQAVFGMHVMPRYKTGTYVYKSGTIMSSIDDFRITVTGTGTHASMPWTGSDAIYSSAQIINGAQSIISRRTNLMQGGGVLSFGTIQGGTASNVIPNEVKMSGTIRTASPVARNTILTEFPPMVRDVATAFKTKANVQIANIYPVTVNNPKLTEAMMPMLAQVNKGHVEEIPVPSSGSEDFSFYAEKVPGLFIFLGISNPDGGRDISNDSNIHSAKLMMDERALAAGVAAHVTFVLGYPLVAQHINVSH